MDVRSPVVAKCFLLLSLCRTTWPNSEYSCAVFNLNRAVLTRSCLWLLGRNSVKIGERPTLGWRWEVEVAVLRLEWVYLWRCSQAISGRSCLDRRLSCRAQTSVADQVGSKLRLWSFLAGFLILFLPFIACKWLRTFVIVLAEEVLSWTLTSFWSLLVFILSRGAYRPCYNAVSSHYATRLTLVMFGRLRSLKCISCDGCSGALQGMHFFDLMLKVSVFLVKSVEFVLHEYLKIAERLHDLL